MISRAVAAVAVVFLMPMGTRAALAADAKTLTALFDQYNTAVKAVKADNLEPALAFRTTEYRERGADQRKRYPQARQNALEEMRFFVPLDYAVESAAVGVEVAALAMQANLKIDIAGHPKRGQTVRQLLWVDYELEKGAWRIANIMLAPDADKIKRSPDSKYEAKTNFDPGRETSLGGRIMRVAFEPDHTLLVVLMLDEEQLAYLPDKATLESNGFNTERLKSPRVIEIRGHPHRTNKYKTLATGAQLR